MPKISKWGNSLGVRIPAHIAERAALHVNDECVLRLLDSGEVLMRIARAREIPAKFLPLQGDGVPEAAKPVTDAEVDAGW